MQYYFLDTSALAQRYVDEIGSEWVADLFDSDDGVAIYVAEITTVELTSAIVRRSRGGSMSTDEADSALIEFDRHLIRDYFVLEITSELLFNARFLVKAHGLRAYDSVQLAVAEHFNSIQIDRALPRITLSSPVSPAQASQQPPRCSSTARSACSAGGSQSPTRRANTLSPNTSPTI